MNVFAPKLAVIRRHENGLWVLFLTPPGSTTQRLYFPTWDAALAFAVSRFSTRAAA